MPDDYQLTDNEGALLALVLRRQPITAYQIARAFEKSPIHTFNTSNGKLYPLVRRLTKHGLLGVENVVADDRGTQRFFCTEAGRAVLKAWIQQIRPEHDLLHDPLRKKLQAFDLLTRDEQIEWVRTAREALQSKLDQVVQYDAEVEGEYGELMRDGAKRALDARLNWLDHIGTELR